MDNKIYVMDFCFDSIVDGVGIRDVLFVSGCPHHCFKCHNQQTWNINNGTPMNINEVFDKLTSNSLSTGITLTGGEPFNQARQLIPLVKRIKKETNKDIWIYSGWTYGELIKDKYRFELLKMCDVLVDGPFEIDKRDTSLMFRGSSNQRVLELKDGKIVKELYKEND